MSRKFQVKVIPSEWIVNDGFRLDCGPYLAGAIEAKELLRKFKNEPLKEISNGIFHAGRESRMWVDNAEYGIPFLGSTDILGADNENLPFISKKQVKANPAMLLHEGMSLITRSGTIGRMAYCRSDLDGMACSEHAMRVVPNEAKVKPGYLYAYLSSRFGIPIVISGTYGSIIQSIEPQHLADIPVPRLGAVEQQAHDLVQRAANNLTESSSLMKVATKQLFYATGLVEPKRQEYLGDNRRLGWAESSHNAFSLRALYYDPRVKELMGQVTSIPFSKLGEIVLRDNFEGHIIFKRIDSDEENGIMLLGQRDAFQLRPVGRWISKKSIVGLGLEVPPNTTIIACHGTLGENELYCRAAYVTTRSANYAYSGDFYRCIPKADLIPPGYLYAFLRSNFAFRLIRAMSTGSKQQYQHPVLMAEMPIPRLDNHSEAEIGDKVEKAAKLRDSALELEDQARALVERAIEEGGQ
jgi:type I restriction enzyme S subunit